MLCTYTCTPVSMHTRTNTHPPPMLPGLAAVCPSVNGVHLWFVWFVYSGCCVFCASYLRKETDKVCVCVCVSLKPHSEIFLVWSFSGLSCQLMQSALGPTDKVYNEQAGRRWADMIALSDGRLILTRRRVHCMVEGVVGKCNLLLPADSWWNEQVTKREKKIDLGPPGCHADAFRCK